MDLKVLTHPLINHKLSIMRSKDCNTKDFRQNLDEIAGLMAYEISRSVPTKLVEVETPITTCFQETLACDIVLVPILRAGLGMVDGIRQVIPTAKIGHIGIYRDEETLEPKQYFNKLPITTKDSFVMVLDPMLATGVSAAKALELVKETGATNIKLVCLVGCPEGVRAIQKAHPDVEIFLAALDQGLNEKSYIVPGLGDAGDRLFGTK